MRLFLAATFPDSVIGPLNERLTALKPRLPAASWVRPDTQHLTFAFLGEQKEQVIDTLAPLVEAELDGMRRFEARLQGAGFFPNPRHARVGWVGVQPEERFCDLAAAVRAAVKTAGVELDRADFRPHLTMMRIRDPWPPASIDLFQKTMREVDSAPFKVDAVTLFSSRLNPSGAVHTPVRQFPLT
ncbi:MAG TPA: RNA 2',3'-cyclic phosphodiesterase [Thermoanaerobaculia bacterium]|jgi:2'-5' RNA ligase|nr:RNA 2',3'-cyclic phosphodiesterase [Thermoanaerobaculia bacterium]